MLCERSQATAGRLQRQLKGWTILNVERAVRNKQQLCVRRGGGRRAERRTEQMSGMSESVQFSSQTPVFTCKRKQKSCEVSEVVEEEKIYSPVFTSFLTGKILD